MPSRGSLVVILVATFSFISTTAFSQSSIASDGLYCTAGLQPDGYIDFSSLPPAPRILNKQGRTTPSAAITASFPVRGVPNLTVTVTIPPLYNLSVGSHPAYSVDGGTLRLNGLPRSNSASVLSLAFDHAIRGVGLNTETSGRFEYTYTLGVGQPAVDSPPIFSTSATGYTLDLGVPQTQSLQMVALLYTLFQTASIEFSGDEYSNITLSNIRVQSTSAPDSSGAVPETGLQQWLRADQAAASLGSGSGTWQDQSGHGHDATPAANPPVLTTGGRNCQPAWLFSGKQDFSFNLPISGWTEMTVFLVARAENAHAPSDSFAGNSAISWTEQEPWGDTFLSPYQAKVYARFGTAQPGNTLYYGRPVAASGRISPSPARSMTTALTAST